MTTEAVDTWADVDNRACHVATGNLRSRGGPAQEAAALDVLELLEPLLELDVDEPPDLPDSDFPDSDLPESPEPESLELESPFELFSADADPLELLDVLEPFEERESLR